MTQSEKLKELLGEDEEKRALFNTNAQFRVSILAIANGGSVSDIILQLCKAQKEASDIFMKHIHVCPLTPKQREDYL